jgi:hypothetical protein
VDLANDYEEIRISLAMGYTMSKNNGTEVVLIDSWDGQGGARGILPDLETRLDHKRKGRLLLLVSERPFSSI